jgi:hypothetical protein
MPHELIFYKTPEGEQRIEVVYQDENFWMTQRALAELFAVGIPAINKHLKNIYETGELEPESTLSKMEIVRREANTRSAPQGRFLQSRRHHRGRLPGQQLPDHSVPHLGDQDAQGRSVEHQLKNPDCDGITHCTSHEPCVRRL